MKKKLRCLWYLNRVHSAKVPVLIITLIAIIGSSIVSCKNPEDDVPALTGTVNITGTTAVGQTLTANTSSLGGNGTISYQWKRGTTNIGAGSNTYIVKTGDIGSTITVTVTRAGYSGSVTSEPVTVNAQVNAQTPAITSQPASATVTFNALHGLSVTANVTDGGTLSYQWYSNSSASNSGGTIIAGAISAVYNPPTDTVETYYYFVEMTNTISDNGDGGNKTASTRSNAITLTVNAKVNAQTPIITSQPASATTTFNASHSLSVTANVTDGGTLSYQWYSNTSAYNSGGAVIAGAISAVYSPPTGMLDTYYYFVEVTNTISDNGDGGNKTASVRSNVATLTVNKATGIFGTPTAINTTYTPSLILSNLNLPTGYAWNTPATGLNAGNGQSFPATYTDPSGNYEAANGNITINVAKATGTTVNALVINTITHNSITIDPVTTPNGQQVEYSISVSSTVPLTGWQASTTFSDLNGATAYCIFARAAENDNYETGEPSDSLLITTLQTVSENRFEYYWVDQHGSLVTSSGGAIAIAAGETLIITAQGTGYVVKQWHLNGVNTGQNGDTYSFSSTITGKHIVGLFVEMDDKLYNTNITIMVGE
jgi:hypothetical protein